MQTRRRSNGLVLIVATLLGLANLHPAQAQEWQTISAQRLLSGEEALRVSVEYGAGKLIIAPGKDNSLYRATLRYDGNAFRPLNKYENGRLRIGVDGGSIKKGNLKSGRLDLALGTAVALDLDLKFGAAEADLELGGLRVRSASIETGASDTRIRVSSPNPESCSSALFKVGAAKLQASGLGNLNCEAFGLSGGVGEVLLDFSGSWRGSARANVEMGLGSLTLRLPRGLGVSVRKSGILASFDSQGLIKRGDVYYSENFERAEHKLTINLDAALGSIRVQWVDNDLSSR